MTARVTGVFGNMVVAEVDGRIVQNSVAHCLRKDGARLKAEVIRVRGNLADLQVFEETRGLRVGDGVELSDEMLSVTLGPGLLGQIYDGLQTPLPALAEECGIFLQPGTSFAALPQARAWLFSPAVRSGQTVAAGDALGFVPEGEIQHCVGVPFAWKGRFEVESVVPHGEYRVADEIAVLLDEAGHERRVTMEQRWAVRMPLRFGRRIRSDRPLGTKVRVIDSLFPVIHGGTFCIPGPFGAGKTVLQQIMARHAEVDVVVVAACGERAGEVVETLSEFPALRDPRTGRSLMERTIIIANTSAMPVAARESSVYTAVTLGEYYRQMGLDVLLLADSTSRWAQAMRELSGRLEEIPGEEAFPAYLESRIASFYERAGALVLKDGRVGALTIGGTVSPAGGSFEEPVTQATLKTVGAFHGLSTARAQSRRFPAIDPLESWSKYAGSIDRGKSARIRALLHRGREIRQMMAVVGEEGITLDDLTIALEAELVDACYLQQNAFDDVDGATGAERQVFVLDKLLEVLDVDFAFEDRNEARRTLLHVTDLFRNWNYAAFQSDEFVATLADVDRFISSRAERAAMQGAPLAEAP